MLNIIFVVSTMGKNLWLFPEMLSSLGVETESDGTECFVFQNIHLSSREYFFPKEKNLSFP